uniref:Fatty acid hydroxylase domain-containing protein n=1 Tax=viral metagenome TaxID=1070528 RepID=A0A6C0FDB2_9ZZZZ
MLEYIFAYYLFTFEQYLLHKLQHNNDYYKTHLTQHHNSYDKNDITIVKRINSLYENLDLYFYGNILCIISNYNVLKFNLVCFQLIIGYLSYYFHNEYHNKKSIWLEYQFFKYLKRKHSLHHKYCKNYFLLEPTFDIIFGTYK